MRQSLSILLLCALLLTLLPLQSVSAQDEPLPVLILPIDRATFLAGALFDFRVEVHADEMPADFAVTINGEPAADFFGAEGAVESWTFGPEESPTPSQSLIWRDLTLTDPGLYVVTVTAGGAETSVNWYVRAPQPGAGARNVILFVADGMTVPMLTAARVVSRGNPQGKFNGYFAMDQMEEIGLVNTSGMDSIITDSANSASSYNTGHKAAINALGTYADTSPDTLDDPKQETFASLVKRTRGMSVGIVTTAEYQDATPAAVFAHTRRRADYPYIAAAPLDSGLLPEVIMGGGARALLPQSVEGSRRQDDRDLFVEYEEAGYTVVTTASELVDAFSESTPERLLGIFNPGNMNTWLDRNVFTDNLRSFTDQPELVDMTLTALEVLNQNPNGFYLMVEAAMVDKLIHPLDQERMIADIIEFDNAIATTIEWAALNAPDTLILITADHGHGYEVYGTVDVEEFNAAADDAGKRNAIKIYGDAGFPTYEDADGDFFPDRWDVSITLAGLVNNHPDYTEDFQVSPVPRTPAIVNDQGIVVDNPDDDPNGIPMSGNLPMNATTGVHTLQDVPIFASGPGAAYFGRVMDNTEVFFGMAYAIGLNPLGEMETETPACEGVVFNGRCYVR
jgi:alkaline phosphatase